MANRSRPGSDGPNRSALFFPGATISLRSWSVFHPGFWQSNRAADQSAILPLFSLASAKWKRIQLVAHSRDQTGVRGKYPIVIRFLNPPGNPALLAAPFYFRGVRFLFDFWLIQNPGSH